MSDVDIVIVAHNQIEFTKRCVESIFRTTNRPFHLILVNNASRDATNSYFIETKQKESNDRRITIVTNEINQGYALAINQGLQISTAPYVMLCNNDIELFPYAIDEMISVANQKKEFGLVNPNSNEFGLASYNEILLKEQKGRYSERCHTSGFCVLVKREVIEKIGEIESVFSPGYFEDMDYAERAKRAGFFCVVAKGAYVYHAGTKTFLPTEKQKLWERNREIFNQKWGGTKWYAYIADNHLFRDSRQREKIVNGLLEVARQEIAMVHLFVPRGKGKLFRDLHDSFRIVEVPQMFRALAFLFKLWSSFNKKPITRIYVSSRMAYDFWNFLRPLHHAEVRFLPNE